MGSNFHGLHYSSPRQPYSTTYNIAEHPIKMRTKKGPRKGQVRYCVKIVWTKIKDNYCV